MLLIRYIRLTPVKIIIERIQREFKNVIVLKIIRIIILLRIWKIISNLNK